MHTEPAHSDSTSARKAIMAVVARATVPELSALETWPPTPKSCARPEIGLVMVRGRIGGDGAPFNLGEATVTRAALALPGGEIGYGHVLGRDKDKARLAALADALWQAPATREAVEACWRRCARGSTPKPPSSASAPPPPASTSSPWSAETIDGRRPRLRRSRPRRPRPPFAR